MNHRTRIPALAVAAAGILTACGQPAAVPVSYAPQAYGIPGQCYYADSPLEATALIAAGLCPGTWAPTPMPLAWHERYYPYYSSPAYYSTYVPASSRTVYVTHQTTFQTTYHTQIITAEKTAVYKDNKGKTVTNPDPAKVSKAPAVNGGGAARVPVNGGGAGRTGAVGGAGSVVKPAPVVAPPKAPPKPVSNGGGAGRVACATKKC